MSESQKIRWEGTSGKEYEYYIYSIETSFKKEPGNYIFAKESKPGYWKPTYIGQTKDLDQRLENHEKEDCAKRNGATHIHAHINNQGEDARLKEEQDLISKWHTPCND